MIPLSDELPTTRTPWMTYILLAAMLLTWVFVQGAGFDQQALAASVCNLGMVPGELTHMAPIGQAVPLGRGMACVVDNDPINIFTPVISMFLHGGWGHILGNGLFFWRDVIPVEPDGTHITTVPSTVAGITSWLSANHRLRVSDPMKVVIGKGLDTTTMVVDVPDGTVNKDHVCADIAPKAACFPILTDPAHWDGAWTVVSGESSRYYLADIGPASDRHLLVVAVVAQADPATERLRLERAVAPILDSLDVSRVTFN